MLCLVCHRTTSEAIEATFRGQKDLVSDIVLSDEIAEQLLIHPSLIYNRGIPKRAAKFYGLQKDRLGLLQRQIVAQAE